MTRKDKLICLTITTMTSLAMTIALFFHFNESTFVSANYFRNGSSTWVHYPQREPTEEQKGIKEYWVQCGGTYQFTAPESGNIIEATGYDTSEFLEDDDRWIPNEIICDAEYWYGKKWVALGTSITATTDTNHDGVITGHYPNTLEELSGLVQTNYGFEGANMGGHPLLLSLFSYYKTNISNADIVTVECGVNDWYGNRPLGTIDDTMAYYNDWRSGGINLVTGYKTGTFAGSCYSVLTNIKNINPTATILVLTDCSGPDNGSCAADKTNALGLHLSDYNQMMIDIAESLGVKYIDVGAECGITGQDTQYFSDHVHLNEAGGEVYANYIWEQMQTFTKKIHTDKPKVTVTFKTNNEVINTQTFESGGSAYAPYPGTYEERDFLYYDHSLRNITSNTVINSVWTDNRITLTFDTDGGSTIADIVGFAGDPIGEVPTPTKEGYIFDGWDKTIPAVMPNTDTTFTALWREEDNLFSRLTETKSKRLMIDGSDGHIYEYTQNGYNLSEYIAVNNKKLIIEFDVKTVKSATMYSMASFNVVPSHSTQSLGAEYSIYYESYTTQNEYFTVTRDGNHYVVTWTGYNYIRVAYEKANLYNLSVKYATYTVTFSDGDNIISEQEVVYGESAVAPENPTKEGYIFDGWDKSFTNIKSDLLVTAKWRDEDELFDSTQVLKDTFINSTFNDTASGYNTSNYFAQDYNHKIRIVVTLSGSGIGDFRIALGSSNNDKYLAAWQVGSSSTYFVNSDTFSDAHVKIVRTIEGNTVTYVFTNKNTGMHFSRISYVRARISSISVKNAD